MSDYVTRMMACGVPVRTAVKVYVDFKRRGKLEDLSGYISYVEEVVNGRMEAV